MAIDSATTACSVALFDGDTLVDGTFRMLGRGHAEALVPMIAALPDRGRADRIAVALGPGSFTGVRVGLAAARALALAWNAELVGYSSLSLVAAIARLDCGTAPVGVAMTGGHGEWFVQGFGADGMPSTPLRSLRPDVAAATCHEDIVAGDQAEALVAARGHGRALTLWPDACRLDLLPPASLTADCSPLYGRAPDARVPAGEAPACPA